MLATFFLMLREGIEAALIVGIVAAYLVKIGRRDALGKVALGVGAAVGLSVAIGVIVSFTISELPEIIQATAEALAAIVAVVVLTWMLFWMRRQGRALKGELERGVDLAISDGSTFALVTLVFVSVIREGVETVLFLVPILSFNGSGIDTVLGGVLGLAAAVAVGWAIFVAGRRVNLRRFFTVTGAILIFVAAGLVAFAITELGNAGLFANAGEAFNLNGVLSDASPLGSVLHGLFGYRSAPTVLEVLGYLVYLVPVLVLFVLDRPLFSRPTVAAMTLALAFGLSLGACGGASTASFAPAPSGALAVEAKEFLFTPAAVSAPAGKVTFWVRNGGTANHEFELFNGGQSVGLIEGFEPGLAKQLAVTLAAGEYTFLCKLNGHDQLGMKGTLTVTPG